jgi:signal transduction histidine kinase
MLRRLSIRARITLGSLLIGAVVLSGIAVVLHLQVHDATLGTEQSLAESDAAPFITDLRRNPGERPDDPSAGVLVGVRDPTGTWLVDSLPTALRPLLPTRMDSDRTMLRVRANGTVYTVVGYRVTTPEGRHQVWAAHDGAGGELTVRTVDRSLFVGTILALLAFGGTAWLLTTIALRPVTRMRRTAETLSAGPTSGDLPVGATEDELAALARTLNAFLQRQRESAELERRMVSDASHELRTPLAALTARLELAHRSFGDADALEREILEAEASAARLTSLANTLLELSRLDEHDAPDEPVRATALVTELMGAVDRARSLGAAAGIDLDFTVGLDDEDRLYRVASSAFGRVIDNLLANALAFSPTGGSVRVALTQDADAALRLAVTDEGPGLPEDFLPRAFERFARADESRRRVRGGSGLGLALVRGVAERAGGGATIENRREGGAVATVVIPPAFT